MYTLKQALAYSSHPFVCSILILYQKNEVMNSLPMALREELACIVNAGIFAQVSVNQKSVYLCVLLLMSVAKQIMTNELKPRKLPKFHLTVLTVA
jgi:hypothetical protein